MKHAYLIMAHHRMDLLQLLISALDDIDNNFYVHIDKKYKGKDTEIKTKHSNVYFIKRKDVRWAGYSQIACELQLLEAAFSSGIQYDYYHLLTGVSYPIKSNKYIKNFFQNKNGYEFVGFDNEVDFLYRVRYYYIYSEAGKKNRYNNWKYKHRKRFLLLQKKMGINRVKKSNIVYKKGSAYWSITNSFVSYILKNKKFIKKTFRYTLSGDEMFVQTLLFNSPFKDKIYDYNNEYNGCCFLLAWPKVIGEERDDFSLLKKDFDLLVNSEMLFALKFDGDEGIDLINYINTFLNSKNM